MKFSELFTRTVRQAPKDEISKNAEFLTRAGYVDKLMSGVYTYLPLGLRVLNKIKNIIREEMNNLGAQEILMPVLTPKENWVVTGRENMDVLFHLSGAGEREYVLGATHEEVVTPLVQKFVKSYKDLPVAVYQIQDKFRNEPRAKSGILRGREFSMKDLYNFDFDEKRFDEFYERATQAYFQIYDRVGLGGITLLTYASGGAFSRYSHEFQTLCPIGEDEIYVCEKCQVAINKEIIAETSQCPKCGSAELTVKNAIEVGNIFKLKNKFSSAFGFTCPDETGVAREIIMGCYGIGPSRLMGTIVEIHHDERGIIWPESVAPYQVHLMFIGCGDDVKKEADHLYAEFRARGVEVLYDDRDAPPGEKLADADLLGLPYRVLISEKTLARKSVEIKNRAVAEAELVPLKKVVDKIG